MNSFIIKDINISFNDILKIINEDLNLSIHSSVIDKINSSRSYLEKKITDSDESYYELIPVSATFKILRLVKMTWLNCKLTS